MSPKTIKLFAALFIGTGIMLCILLYCRKWYRFPRWKTIVTAPIITLTALLSSEAMYFVENGEWGGISLFGGLFLLPLWFLLVSKLLRLPYYELLDTCAPAGCMMLSLMKVGCLLTGCCQGRVLHWTSGGEAVRFPSPFVEMCATLILAVVLLLMMQKGKYRGTLYPRAMIIYGMIRFVLNLLRDTEPFILFLPAGNFWALISIAIGVVLLTLLRQKGVRKS